MYDYIMTTPRKTTRQAPAALLRLEGEDDNGCTHTDMVCFWFLGAATGAADAVWCVVRPVVLT